MLTTAEEFLLFHVPQNGCQEENVFQYHFPKDQSEANWPVVPWFLLLACLEDRYDIFSPKVFGQFSQIL